VDPIFDRLGRLFRSAFEDSDDTATETRSSGGDSDLDDAMDELDEFLNSGREAEAEKRRQKEQARNQSTAAKSRSPLVREYSVLGLTPAASMDEVQKAYKKLIIANHPDRFASDPVALKKATEMTQKINEAYQKIKSFYEKK
jgi:curved DNA-binding protein CbpA